ncbi:hypothetical protein [Pseudorhodoplanes sp.]|uniref:hypothetical protein n=1 Tax=Pseudorhodoplanes sp. TaxID=1934341 RepID=UPI003D0F5BF4
MATNIQWRTGVSGDWFIAGNWVPDTVPVTGDIATIADGIAIIDTPSNPLVGIAIVLAADDTILKAIGATFEGTVPPPGTAEINATLTVSGALADSTDAVFIVEGETSFDGQIFVEAIAGSLTILVQNDANGHASVFKLLNTDQKAAVVVSQESFLDFEGQTIFNQGLIQIEGSVEISAGMTVTGTDSGAFLLENGGKLIVEGNVGASQQVVFIDGTGLLMMENVAGFEGVIAYAELPTPSGQPHQGAAGGRIDLAGIVAQSLTYVPGSGTEPGTLKLFAGTDPAGTPVAELRMRLVTDNLSLTKTQMTSSDFLLSSDGQGGTVVTYNPGGASYLLESLPAPVIASAGEVVSLASILEGSFGTSKIPFKGIWLYPSQPFDNTSTNVGYWDTPNQTPEWYISGKKVETATFVKDIGKVTLHAGNQIDSPASFQLRLTEDKRGPDATFVTYNVWTVDPAVIQAMQIAGLVPGAAPTPETIMKAAEAFLTVYGDGVIPNTNLCNWIADNVAAAAGAPMPGLNASLDPSLNLEGGFWRIVYASDIPDPVSDWSGLVQPGDIVRMGWFKPEAGRISGHSTTVLSYEQDGKIEFYDNNDGQHIGRHEAAYWLATDPEDITIYRLDPNHQYLITGTDAAETIRGSIHDDLIRPGGGADIIKARFGDNEIEGTAAQLNGIKVTHFDLGDSFHFSDLDPESTFVDHHDGKLRVFDEIEKVATIKVPKPGGGLEFVVTSDIDGGVTIELAQAPDHQNGLGQSFDLL